MLMMKIHCNGSKGGIALRTKFAKLLFDRSIKQSDLVASTGIKAHNITFYKKGMPIPASDLNKLADALNVNPRDLVGFVADRGKR
jgi:DNA-binding Xre family transcriptional regulator